MSSDMSASNSRRQQGFSLVEILLVLVVLGIMYQFAGPALKKWQQHNEFKQQVALLKLMLGSSRERAISLQKRVTLCPLVDGNKCGSQWNDDLVLFMDNNNNYQLDADEYIVHRFQRLKHRESTRHFNNKAISFNERGHAGFATGTLSFCLHSTEKYQATFVISRAGRVRFSQLIDRQKTLKMPNGQPVACG